MANYNGTNGANTYYGTVSGDGIYGWGGGDTLYGEGGADLIYGGNGNDFLSGGIGGDFLNGGLGSDTMFGDDGNDVFEFGGSIGGAVGGHNGWDYIYGGAGTDTLKFVTQGGWIYTAIEIAAMNGVEQIQNYTGIDGYVYFSGAIDFTPITQLIAVKSIIGSTGTDVFTGGSQAEIVEGNAGNDTLYGYGGNDTLFGDVKHDPTGNATLFGDDTLYGGAGDDTLDGQDGADYLNGGTGFNFLTGGLGNDTFHFEATATVNTILDYASGSDIIKISTALADDFSDLAIANNGSGNAVVSVGSLSIEVIGVDSSALTAFDFTFA